MSVWSTTGEVFARWTDTAAAALVTLLGRFVSPRVVCLTEGEGDNFLLQVPGKPAARAVTFADGHFSEDMANAVKGSRVELVLQPHRFLMRPLELPARATDFIDGIVRAQIDRLTPWSAAEAVFGCSRPAAAGADRIVTTVAATRRGAALPYLAALAPLHPAAVTIFAAPGEGAPERIKVLEQQSRGLLDPARLGRVLRLTLAGAAAAAVLATVVNAFVGDYLDGRRAELTHELATRRAALQVDNADHTPLAALARRKHAMQASVIVMDELARILPDHTYVTELRIEGNKLQVVGVTQDAPSLIRLMEQSAHFSRATFFAPTTRGPSDPGERFHIEANLEPVNTVTR